MRKMSLFTGPDRFVWLLCEEQGVLIAGAIDKLSHLWIKWFGFIDYFDKVDWPPERVLKSWRLERLPFCRNASFRNSLRWPIYLNKTVDKTKLFGSTVPHPTPPHPTPFYRHSTALSSENYFLYLWLWFCFDNFSSTQNQSVNTTWRKSILFYLFLFFFQGSRQSECEEKTMKQPKIVVSLKVMNFCQTTTQGDRTCVEKTFSKYICPCTKILVFCRLKHQVTWQKFLSGTASCVS